jgi:hypothetical protein
MAAPATHLSLCAMGEIDPNQVQQVQPTSIPNSVINRAPNLVLKVFHVIVSALLLVVDGGDVDLLSVRIGTCVACRQRFAVRRYYPCAGLDCFPVF